PVVAECPYFLDQPIIELATPFAREECLDLLAAVNEFGAVAPDAVDGIAESDARGIASVPGIFGETRFLRGCLGCERRHWWTGHGLTPAGSGSSVAAHRDAVAFKRAASTLRCRRAFCGAACRWPQRLHWPLPERWPRCRTRPSRPAARNSQRCGPRWPAPRSCAASDKCRNWFARRGHPSA